MFRYFYKERGRRPVVPLRNHLMWLADYIDSANFIPLSTFHWPYKDEMSVHEDYLPLRWANQVLRGYAPDDFSDMENCMLDKYRLVGLETDMWKDIKLNFKENKADSLLKHLGLKEINGTIKNFILVNEHSQAGKVTINPSATIPVVKMTDIPGYTVIDWYLVMQMALENHHVSTSTFFIMQAIKNRLHFDSKVFIYPRPNVDGLRGISQLHPTFEFTKVL